MTTIDQAFVKAFHKNRQAKNPTERTESPEEARAAALGMSTIWIDPSNEQRWRTDQPHSQLHQSSTDQRSRGASPHRLARPAPSDSQSVETIARPDLPVAVRSNHTDGVPPLKVSAGQGDDAVAETVFDIRMFDAIDVTPPPFALFSQPRAIAEAPLQRPLLSHSATERAVAEADHPLPTSVPFVKIHDRAASETNGSAAELFAGADSAVEEAIAFEAAWEVDRFEYPAVVQSLLEEEGLVADAVAPLVDACRGGLQTLVVTSSTSQQGRTTLATGLALATAKAGLRVALLDIDTDHPALADQLQLEVETGWTEAVRKGTPLEETAIYSMADRLTLLPIIACSPPVLPTRDEIVATLRTLRQSFDLIILDAAAIDMEAAMRTQLPANQLDSALVVRDRREADQNGFEECVAALRQMGIEHIGVADNFTESAS